RRRSGPGHDPARAPDPQPAPAMARPFHCPTVRGTSNRSAHNYAEPTTATGADDMRTTHRFLLSSGVLAALALAACQPADTSDDFTLESPDTPAMDPMDPAAAPMPTDTRSYATDAEIFSFVSTANTYEIESAQLAL